VSADEIRERVRRTVQVVRDELPATMAGHIIELLREVWAT
jgi:hypothetical protein